MYANITFTPTEMHSIFQVDGETTLPWILRPQIFANVSNAYLFCTCVTGFYAIWRNEAQIKVFTLLHLIEMRESLEI